jgi:xanthine dehydrogenase iron-sulfur cluster and FAD-binding subunit A
MWKNYYIPATLEETLRLLAENREKARLVAGATDLMLELERGVRKGVETVIDVTRLPNMDRITLDEDEMFHIGPLVTHNGVVASKLVRESAAPLATAAWQVGAPQIRNRATVAGNLITASPANDTITPLMAMGTVLTLASVNGTRRVALKDFYTGVRKTVMQPDEMLVDITFPALKSRSSSLTKNGGAYGQHGTFIKLGLRRAQAISLVNTAVLLDLNEKGIRSAVITLGAVAPTIIHASEAEGYLKGKELTDEVIAGASDLAAEAARPIDDIRGSAAYRKAMVRVLVKRALVILREGKELNQVPDDPVLLWGKQAASSSKPPAVSRKWTEPSNGSHENTNIIRTTINGKKYSLNTGFEKSLLRFLREDVGLTGTKEGCAEGECGACTVFLDGKAVMACLVPAGRADGAEIVTVEGLAVQVPAGNGGAAEMQEELHPVQAAFVADGAVQCGYCTPGFIMSAAKLLEERPNPGRDEITQAISGNLCRCTGYYKIIQAIEDASKI